MEKGARAGTRRGGGGRGVSMPAFLATLVVLLVLLLVALEFVNRWTRIPVPAVPSPSVRLTLDLAVRTLTRDLSAAASGRLPALEAIRPVADNTPPRRAFTGPVGQETEIRAGTDQVGLRGILRTPPLTLERADRATGRPFASNERSAPGEIQARPAAARLKVYERSAGGDREGEETGFSAAAALLRSRPLTGSRKRFFAAGDAEGRYAVARILAVGDRTASAK